MVDPLVITVDINESGNILIFRRYSVALIRISSESITIGNKMIHV
jgi:hypothetical protein